MGGERGVKELTGGAANGKGGPAIHCYFAMLLQHTRECPMISRIYGNARNFLYII